MSGCATLAPQVIQALLERERLSLTGRLLPGLVHNLTGALQMVRLPLDLMEMQMGEGDGRAVAGRLPSVLEGVQKLNKEIQALAARSTTHQDREPRAIDLADLAEGQLRFWRGDMFFKHEVRLEKDLEPGRGCLVQAGYADAALAFNLVMANALESLAPSGQKGLEVAAFCGDGRAGLVVSDQGPGPDPGLGESIFEPFVTDKGPGHQGLGLFLARQALMPWQGGVGLRPGAKPGFEISFPRAA